jgi:adenylate cyclase
MYHELRKAGTGVKPTDVLTPFKGALSNIGVLEEAAAGVGGINLSQRDRSGVVRRIPMLFSDGERIYPGLASEALRVAQAQKGIVVRGTGASGEADSGHAALLDMRVGDFRIPLTDDGETWVYYDRNRPERYVSVRDLLDPAKEAEVRPRIEGAIILVGTSAAGLIDARATPLGQLVPGVSIHAQLIEQILAQDFINRPDWADGLEIIVTVLLAVFVAVMLVSFGAQFSLIAGVVALVLAVAGSWFAFSHFRLLLDPIYPSLAAITMYIAMERMLRVASDKEKKFVRQAFGQYLAPELLARLESSPKAMELGGEAREITVMFMDVRGFTPISEKLSATELVDFINTLLQPLSEAIQTELGTIDKYIGDSIMAFWNAPLDIADHPARACRAALKMRQAIKQLNADDAFGFEDRGISGGTVRIGVGLNFGIACVGNMGSERRFNYSAMGDVVNVSARIESATKEFGTDLLVSEEVAAVAKGIALLEAGEILLKGKSLPTKLYALVGDEAVAASDHDADDDPAAGVRHPHQRRPDRDRDSEPQLSDHGGARRAAAAQFLPAAPDAAAGARREEIGQQRPVDGMAEAVHDRAQMRSRRGAVLQGREGRGHALHRQRPVQAGRIRASNCRSAPSSANSACCRRRTCGPRRWNASKPASS